jgi:hypothetical protein
LPFPADRSGRRDDGVKDGSAGEEEEEAGSHCRLAAAMLPLTLRMEFV